MIRYVPRPIRRFWRIAWDANLTGMASMLAYNMLYGIIPIALLGLFVGGKVLASEAVQDSVVHDLQQLFPGATKTTLTSVLNEVRHATTGTGLLALAGSLWLGSMFWGALDTAFSRIYGCPSRPWLKQKRFALGMVLVVLLFMIATVSVPTAQSILRNGEKHLPFDLAHVAVVVYAGSLAIGLSLLFLCLLLIYHRVPNFRVPWKAVWPGALGATVAIGVVDYGFPLYLQHFNTIAQFTTWVVTVVLVLIWFYVLAVIILSGAIVNALRLRPPPPGE
ncbi:MAG TPA: YihY/virulence factor BrkB family protein [Solirubrobacteraceae bacterium]|nr:YihY/virulence factor BrkB family protein [Solirubrobacteraceae bacterium]